MKLHEACETIDAATFLVRRLSGSESNWTRYEANEWREWVADARALLPGLLFLATINDRAGFLTGKLKHFADKIEERLDAEESVKALRVAAMQAQLECSFCGHIAPVEKFGRGIDPKWRECPSCHGFTPVFGVNP